MRYHPFAGISSVRSSALIPFGNLSATQMPGCARLWMAQEGSSCVPSWHPPCPPRPRVFMRMTILPSGPAVCSPGDRTDGTDGSRTLAYFCELRHLAAVPGLRIQVSTRPRGLGYRVVDWTWEAQRVRSSLGSRVC